MCDVFMRKEQDAIIASRPGEKRLAGRFLRTRGKSDPFAGVPLPAQENTDYTSPIAIPPQLSPSRAERAAPVSASAAGRMHPTYTAAVQAKHAVPPWRAQEEPPPYSAFPGSRVPSSERLSYKECLAAAAGLRAPDRRPDRPAEHGILDRPKASPSKRPPPVLSEAESRANFCYR